MVVQLGLLHVEASLQVVASNPPSVTRSTSAASDGAPEMASAASQPAAPIDARTLPFTCDALPDLGGGR